MGFTKEIKSKKAATVNYWRITSFSFNRSGNLAIGVAGYKDGQTFSDGADPIDELEVVFHNADTHIKTLFYDLIENNVPLFRGAEKDLTRSAGQQSAAQVLTVQTPRGDLIERITLEPPPETGLPEAPPAEAPPGETPSEGLSPLPPEPATPETLPEPEFYVDVENNEPENPADTTPNVS